jgi:hypothetical protein
LHARKPATTAFIDGRVRSIEHEQESLAQTIALLDRLNVHTIDGFPRPRAGRGVVANRV